MAGAVKEAEDVREADGVDEIASKTSDAAGLRDFIRNVKDDTYEDVPVEQWKGVVVRVVSMTGTERAKALEKYLDPTTNQIDFRKFYPELIWRTCFHPKTHEQLFTPEDVEWLNEKNAGVLELLAGTASRLSGLDRAARDRAGKDSSSTPSDASTTS